MPIESRIVHYVKRQGDRGTACGLDAVDARKHNDYTSNSVGIVTCLPCLRKLK